MIDFDQSNQYTLSIRLSTDGFSFYVFDPHSKEEPFYHEQEVNTTLSLTANLKQTFQETAWLSRPFRKVHVLVASPRFTFIPLEYFEDEQAETVFYHNHTQRDNETVLYNILHKNNIVVLFGIDKSSHSFLLEQHPSAHFYAQASPFIDLFAGKSRLGNNRKLYAYLHSHTIDLYGYERSRLLLGNSFQCRDWHDKLYYLLYTWKQLGLDQERDELHLSGMLQDKNEWLTELKKYIRQVYIMNPSSHIDLEAIVHLGD